jgi:hypothetical protein
MRCQIRGRTAVVGRAPRPSHRLVLPVLVTVAAVTVGAAATAAPPRFVLDLPGNGSLPGEFVAAEAAAAGGRETLRWQSPLFGVPFEFRLDAISGVRGQTTPPNQPATGYRCRLRGGDIIDGGLEGIDADHVVMVPLAGQPAVKIERGLVLSLAPRDVVGGSGYVGPGGLTGWRQEPADSWRDEAARLVCDRGAAGIWRDVGAPPRARYDLVLSWRKQPEFVVSVGAAAGKLDDPFRFELIEVGPGDWTGMIARQERARGGLEEVKLPAVAKGRLRLSLFVDQQTGRLAAAVGGGERIVEMTVKPDDGRAPSGLFRLTLLAGDICLESLRVTEWKEAEPLFDERSGSAVTTRAGRVIGGDVASFDAAAEEFVVAAADGPVRVPAAELRSIDFSAAREPAGGGPEPVPAVRLVGHGGGVISGDLVAVTDGLILVERPGVTGPIPLPLSDLLSLVSLRSAAPPPLPGRAGTLLLEGVRLPGCLVDAAEWGGGLGWLPAGSLTAAGFAAARDRLAAEVEYVPGSAAGRDRKAPPQVAEGEEQVEVGGIGGAINQDDEGFFVVTMLSEEGAAARDGRIEPGDRILAVRPTADGPFVESKGLELGGIMNLLRGRVGTKVAVRMEPADGGKPRTIELARGLIYVADRSILDEALAAHARVTAGQAVVAREAAGFPAVAVLKSGDSVAARVERIDTAGVRLFSPVTATAGREPVTVPQSLLKAVDLEPAAASRKITPAVFERLLTLPRSQQARPPTHLIRLENGDYLRGRLESLDDEEVRFEVLGQTKRLPRESVVRVIWLHPEDLVPPDEAAEPVAAEPVAAEPVELVVQGVTAAGERTTLAAERVAGTAIIGRSQAFGDARLDTARIDRLLLGGAVGSDDGKLPFAQWQLKLAPLPRALRGGE